MPINGRGFSLLVHHGVFRVVHQEGLPSPAVPVAAPSYAEDGLRATDAVIAPGFSAAIAIK